MGRRGIRQPDRRTPHIDSLAREGVCFRNAFVTTPISAASRASLLTGMYERTHGYTFRQGPLKEPYMQQSYPVLLRASGYTTAYFGKFGVTYPGAQRLFDAADLYDRRGKFPDRRGYFYKTIDGDTVHLTRYTGYEAQHSCAKSIRRSPSVCRSVSVPRMPTIPHRSSISGSRGPIRSTAT